MEELDRAVEDMRHGEEASFRQVVEATETRCIRLAARLMGNMADAEDVVQDSYIKAYKAISEGAFDGRSKVERWLIQIVTRTALDALRMP